MVPRPSTKLERILYSIHVQTTYGAGPGIHKSVPTYRLVSCCSWLCSRSNTRAASTQPVHRNSSPGEKIHDNDIIDNDFFHHKVELLQKDNIVTEDNNLPFTRLIEEGYDHSPLESLLYHLPRYLRQV